MYLSISRLLAAAALLAGAASPAVAAPSTSSQAAVPPTGVTCTACIVVDDAGRTLFDRRAHEPLPNASTTKMVTALVVVARADLTDDVVVSARAAAVGQGGLDLDPGDVYTVHDLLYALLLTSSNEAAVALAEHVAGSEPAFVDEMNALAGDLGATDTHYVTSHGLDRPGHVSSAYDLALIAAAVLDRPLLARIVAAPSASIAGPAGTELIANRNVLLETYPGAVGVKTGFTSNAGNVLVAAARRHDRVVIAVAMHSIDAASDARELLDYGFDRLRQTVLLAAHTPLGELVFGGAGSAPAVVSSAVRGIADPASVEVDFRPSLTVRSPLELGDVVGSVVVMQDDRTIATVDAVAGASVDPGEPPWVAEILGALLRIVAAIADRRAL